MDFDASKAVEATVKWIQDWFAENGPDCNAIIGISGGKDSSITAALLVEALGKDRVIGIMMPNGEQSDMDMALLLVNHLGINHYVINIAAAYNGAVKDIECVIGELSNDSLINLAPRLRMATLYAVGQSRNGRVANTCNLSEDWVGYSTRYGDAAGDFSPISCEGRAPSGRRPHDPQFPLPQNRRGMMGPWHDPPVSPPTAFSTPPPSWPEQATKGASEEDQPERRLRRHRR